MTQTATGNGQVQAPHSFEAEQATLACCLLGSEALAWAVGNLTPDDFYSPPLRSIYRVAAELYRDGQSVDPSVIAAALQTRGALADVGGAPFIATLATSGVTAANVGYFGREVLALSRRRQVIDLGYKLISLGYQEADPDRAVALGRGLLESLEQGGTLELAGPVEILHAMLEARAEEERGDRVTWGLQRLDQLTRGLPRRKLIVLAARPAQGKSSLALQASLHVARARRALFCSYEMGLAEIGQHHIAKLARTSTTDALLNLEELGAAREAYQQRDFSVIDASPDLDQLVSQVTAAHARRPLDLVMVDYLQLVPVRGRHERRDLEVGAISAALKHIAVRLNVPVVALSSLNRDADGQMPTLRHLRESGAIESDADQVIFLHEKAAEDEDERRQREHEQWRIVLANVAKNRMGPEGVVELRFDEPRTTFAELAPDWEAARDPSATR